MPAKTPARSTSQKHRLVLLDSHAIIHRAYHALPEFATSQGEPTGALYGLSTMLVKLVGDLKPDYIVAAFDLPQATHRHEAYEHYKAGRAKLDDELARQINRAKDVFHAWGIPIYAVPGFEADDIIGTVVEETKKDKKLEVIIASGDMDTLQLVSGTKVQVYTLKKGLTDTVMYDEQAVEERFGFGPELLPDFKGLRGDPSDNIVGVKGIGEKTATSLITTFGTIEKIYKALKKKDEYKKAGITERIKDLLLANEEEAIFSKTLATIRRDAPINFVLPNQWRDCIDMNKVLDLYQELEFRTMGDRVKKLLANGGGARQEAPKKANSAVFTLSSGAPTTSGIALSSAPEDEELKLALWVVDSNITNPTMEDVFRFTKAKSVEEAWRAVNAELDKRGRSREVYEKIEKPLIPVVEAMNACGVKIDREKLEGLSRDYHKKLNVLEKAIWRDAGEEFNIGSPKQLGDILFKKLDLAEARQKKTAGGALSTKESELLKLREKHPIIDKILDYRELAKLLSTYIDSIPKQLDAQSRLHSRFILSGTTTGRMASENPNLQNIPIRSEQGKAIREAFIADNGNCLLTLDYSQIELRIAAILSKDEKLIEIFKAGSDVHAGVAARVFGVAEDKVDYEMRRRAKIINFGILYGMGVSALRQNLGTDRKTAQEFYNNYFQTFTTLASYLNEVKAEAERRGYTETMFGRRRYFAGFKSPLPYVRAQAERMAVNAPIQGTEGDIVKIAMRDIGAFIKKRGWENDARLILNVHDEIVYEVKKTLAEEAAKEFKRIMGEVIPKKETLGVPIVAEYGIGDSWASAK